MTGQIGASENITLRAEGPLGVITCRINPDGASLEALQVDSLDLIERFAEGASRPLSAGVTLAPWPNRVRDGRWEWEGAHHQLEMSEPARNNAIHGLVTGQKFGITSRSASQVVLHHQIDHAPGYPFVVEIEVDYRLSDRGVRVETRATNRGERAAPVAFGAHPYVCLGDIPIRTLTLVSPVAEELEVDDQMIPISSRTLPSTSGLAVGLTLADAVLDTAYRLGGEGPWRTVLRSDEGPSLQLWQDEAMPWIQLFITDSFPGVEGVRGALAIEPMTAPPNALSSGEGLVILPVGETLSAQWGIERLT